MPIPVPFPTPPPTTYPAGTMPVLTLSRGTVQLPLSETDGWVILPGVEGLDDPPRALIEVEPALWDGSLPTGVRYSPREVFLPLHYWTDSTEQLRAQLRALAGLLDPRRGPVTLTVAHADGTVRSLDGRLSAPFGAALQEGEGGLWRQVGLTLRCGDPFWSADQHTLSWGLSGDQPQFLSDTFLPVGVADSQVVGTALVDNPGDGDAWPVWTVTGPCDALTVECADTTFTVDAGLAEGQVLVVDARRGQQTATLDGDPAWGLLSHGVRLASLPPGLSPLDIVVTGATTATRLSVAWAERWLTAW